ncbi:MAG: hypothetical protein KHZ72_10250 [Lachnospiraceae bacterium]|nr:hypothetical protein [Lachnospiraceae bacterium]
MGKVLHYGYLKKRDIKKALKAGAKAGGVSLADVRADIEATIEEVMFERQLGSVREVSRKLMER